MTELSPKEKVDAQSLGISLGNRHALKSIIELMSMLNPEIGDALAQKWEDFVNDGSRGRKIEPHLDAIYDHMFATVEEYAQIAREGADEGRRIIASSGE